MIDQILGRPSPTLRRSQIFLILFFWVWRLYKGDGAQAPDFALSSLGADIGGTSTRSAAGPAASGRVGGGLSGGRDGTRRRVWALRAWKMLFGQKRMSMGMGWIGRVNERLRHFTPYQLVLGTLTLMYALRHLDILLGFGSPEPLARLYSRSYYRATWVNTAFDAGFASAMSIRPLWLKDAMSFAFSIYYLVYHNEGDEVLRRFRALCTVEMLRVTWEKTNNPYVRLVTWFFRPRIEIVEHLTIPRPLSSSRAHLPPVKAMLFFSGTREELMKAPELVVDFPGGGFIAMGPECHEERLRLWAKRTGKPVLGVNYGKAPEYPYPWAIEEGFDAYRTLMETKGRCIGIQSGKLNVVLTGDSAGGNICSTIMLRILEHHTQIPRPVSIILAYPALDFNFTSWMSPANLRVLRTEQSETHIPGLVHGKDHMRHKSPLSVVDDTGEGPVDKRQKGHRGRQKSWGQVIGERIPGLALSPINTTVPLPQVSPAQQGSSSWTASLPRNMSTKVANWLGADARESGKISDDTSSSEDDAATIRSASVDRRREADKSLRERVKTPKTERHFDISQVETPEVLKPVDGAKKALKKKKRAPIGTRLTMTSRVGYFQDRVITPSMMRAMAILYVGPQLNPDFETDYYISPILSPPHLLAHFPPVYFICGERDPFVDDTVILAGKIREAKRRRRAEAQLLQQSRSAKFGEGLRMSKSQSADIPDHILRETDEDWVQMRIIEGWGHGFMQMTSLMREVEGVLVEMADWIDESFVKAVNLRQDMAEVRAAHHRASAPDVDNAPLISPIEHLAPNSSTHVKPTSEYKKVASALHTGYPDLEGLETVNSGEGEEDDGVLAFTPKNKRKSSLPPSRFNPVPRRPSKETLVLNRNNSAPRFDIDETGSSGEVVTIQTPPLGARAMHAVDTEVPKGSGAFAFFNAKRSSATPTVIPPTSNSLASPTKSGSTPIHPSAFAPYGSVPAFSSRRPSSSAAKDGTAAVNKPTNSLVAAAVAGARAASPALAAAGLVPQQVENVSEAELFRRRRMEAVYGMGDTESAVQSDDEGEDGE